MSWQRAKTPLVYDIQELFRWIVDLSVLQMREGKKLKKSDFIVTEKTTKFILLKSK
jgi:CRISPR-associated protein Cas1